MRSVKLSEHAAVAAECVPCCCIADVDFVDCATFNSLHAFAPHADRNFF